MDKFFLLIANDEFYPSLGTLDWKGTFATEEAAWAQVADPSENNWGTGTAGYIDGHEYDHIEVVDLRWMISGSRT